MPQHNATFPPRLFSRGGVFCALLVALAILLIWPVAEVGVQDDPIYTSIAWDFARTGRFIFHGWAAPLLGWQAMWGALFAKLFGATFTAVRLSAVPVAIFSVLLYHAILRRFGLNPAHAIFGTLTLALGPLFLPLSVTFMTDVPGLFSVLVCLYLCQLAIDSSSDSEAILFLAMAALANVALGTARQIGWLGLLVMIPSCTCILRRRRYALPAGIALWVIGVILIRLMTEWFARQPFTAPEKLFPGIPSLHLVHFAIGQFVQAGMTVLLFLLPVLTLGFSSLWPLRSRTVIRAGIAALIIISLMIWFHRNGQAHVITFPWLGVTFGLHGILEDGLFGSNPAIPPFWQKLLLLVVMASAWAWLESFVSPHQAHTTQADTAENSASWNVITVLLLPFLAFNIVLLIPNALFFRLFDRYVLVIIATLLILALRWHQDRASTRIPVLAAVPLALIAILTVADTHDLFSTYRAQVSLARRLEHAGVPRTEIKGGLAFDMQSQDSAWGYINDPRMLNAGDAYKPQPEATPFTVDGISCNYSLQHLFPALHLRYEITAGPSPCVAPTNFSPEPFHAWLPPLRRQLFVGRLFTPEDRPALKP